MSPKEKAIELVDLFYQLFPSDKNVTTTDGELHWEYNDWNQSKKAALIAVEEILNIKGNLNFYYAWCQQKETNINNWYDMENVIPVRMHALKYWNEVKQEIEKLWIQKFTKKYKN